MDTEYVRLLVILGEFVTVTVKDAYINITVNPIKQSAIWWFHFEVFSAIQV